MAAGRLRKQHVCRINTRPASDNERARPRPCGRASCASSCSGPPWAAPAATGAWVEGAGLTGPSAAQAAVHGFGDPDGPKRLAAKGAPSAWTRRTLCGNACACPPMVRVQGPSRWSSISTIGQAPSDELEITVQVIDAEG